MKRARRPARAARGPRPRPSPVVRRTVDPAARQARSQAARDTLQRLRERAATRPRPSPEDASARLDAARARQGAARARQEAVRARLSARRARPDGSARRRGCLLILLILLILLLIRLCACAPPPEPEVPAPVPVPTGPAPVPEPPPPPPRPPTPRLPRTDRPEFVAAPPEPVPWLASFRLQVAARSPRLATCFEGSERPGRLKWTTSVEPGDGHVSEHAIEPMLRTDDLTAAERACVTGVLSDPPYRLDGAEPRSTPHRVGLVIEF